MGDMKEGGCKYAPFIASLRCGFPKLEALPFKASGPSKDQISGVLRKSPDYPHGHNLRKEKWCTIEALGVHFCLIVLLLSCS